MFKLLYPDSAASMDAQNVSAIKYILSTISISFSKFLLTANGGLSKSPSKLWLQT